MLFILWSVLYIHGCILWEKYLFCTFLLCASDFFSVLIVYGKISNVMYVEKIYRQVWLATVQWSSTTQPFLLSGHVSTLPKGTPIRWIPFRLWIEAVMMNLVDHTKRKNFDGSSLMRRFFLSSPVICSMRSWQNTRRKTLTNFPIIILSKI